MRIEREKKIEKKSRPFKFNESIKIKVDNNNNNKKRYKD